MNQLGWRNKLRDMKKQRDHALEQAAQGADTAELDALKADNDKLTGELRAAKMREGRMKKQIEKLKGAKNG